MKRCNHDDCFTCPYPDCVKDQPKAEKDRKDYQKKYYEEHKAEILEKYEKLYKEKKREYARQYYAQHREELKEKANQRYRRKMYGKWADSREVAK